MERATGEADQSLSPGNEPDRIASYVFPRHKATIYGLGMGILVGIGNSFLALDFSFRWELAGTLAVAIVTVLLLHEGLHGGVGRLLGEGFCKWTVEVLVRLWNGGPWGLGCSHHGCFPSIPGPGPAL